MVKNNFPNKSEKSKRKSKRTALEVALYFLGYRSRSEKEIRDRLSRKFEDQEIDPVISQLKLWGFINDQQFASDYLQSRSRSKPRSYRLLKLELKRKGVNVEPDLENLESEEELAKKALSKRTNLKSFPQAVRFLQSRGFSWGVIEKVVKKRYNWDDVNSN